MNPNRTPQVKLEKSEGSHPEVTSLDEARATKTVVNRLPQEKNSSFPVFGIFAFILVSASVLVWTMSHNKRENSATIVSTASSTPKPLSTLTSKATAINPFTQSQSLGDQKEITTGAKKGYVYSCSASTGKGGASSNGPWISGANWDPTKKLAVQGDVAWPLAAVSSAISGNTRSITSNDLPNHHTGTFPIASSDQAHAYDANPNSIKSQSVTYALPVLPIATTSPGCLSGGPIGVMTNGVELFDAFDAGGNDAVAHEIQDSCSGHPQQNGAYHYHGYSACFKSILASDVIGYGLDGFGITGPKKSDGSYYTSADLDECHGTTSTISWDGKTVSMYHYVMTADFPYSIGCFKAKSISSAQPGGSSLPSSRPQSPMPPPNSKVSPLPR